MPWTWKLFGADECKIPEDLLRAFYHLLEDPIIPLREGLDPLLTTDQSISLRTKIRKLCDFYPGSLSSDEIDRFDDGFYELRLMGRGYSYRFFFVQTSPQTFLFLDVISKKYNGKTRKSDLATTRARLKQVKRK
ncbi:hypothetical protein Dcar01_01779 [Deinococcus carri]|uniref:Type II toxin-antitoxin system RelE/ParE family toxin n=1 Tax=Deinococcus carri TaxID=1211323 RepID=A0ABP9WAK5_9DEIO